MSFLSACRSVESMLTDSVGDITPVEGVPSHVKHQLEEAAMDSFLNEMLGGPGNKEARERFRSLWDVRPKRLHFLFRYQLTLQEYEARETPESKLVKVPTPPGIRRS